MCQYFQLSYSGALRHRSLGGNADARTIMQRRGLKTAYRHDIPQERNFQSQTGGSKQGLKKDSLQNSFEE